MKGRLQWRWWALTLPTLVLHAMTDTDFRRWSRWIINAVSVSYGVRGLWLLAAGG